MNTSKLDVFFSALTAFCVVAGGSIVTVIGSQAGGTTALNKTAWILAIATGLVAAGKDVRSLLKLPPVALTVAKSVTKTAVALLAVAFLCGCAYLNSETTRTYSIVPGGAITNVVEKTTATAYTLWDSQSSLTKFKNQSSPSGYGSNTFAPGTYMSNLNESSTSTNINDLAGTIVGAAVTAAIKGAKP